MFVTELGIMTEVIFLKWQNALSGILALPSGIITSLRDSPFNVNVELELI